MRRSRRLPRQTQSGLTRFLGHAFEHLILVWYGRLVNGANNREAARGSVRAVEEMTTGEGRPKSRAGRSNLGDLLIAASLRDYNHPVGLLRVATIREDGEARTSRGIVMQRPGTECPTSTDPGENAVALLSEPVRAWFESAFPEGPTPAQTLAWPPIAAGEHILSGLADRDGQDSGRVPGDSRPALSGEGGRDADSRAPVCLRLAPPKPQL